MLVLVWECDHNLNPTGKEWTFRTKSLRDAIKHVAYENGARVGDHGRSAVHPDGRRFFGSILEK